MIIFDRYFFVMAIGIIWLSYRNLNKVVYRLYSISHYFSDLLDVGSEIKRLKASVQEEA